MTRYHFGMVNTRALHIASETNLGCIAESANYHNGVLHILLKNHTLLTVYQEKIVSSMNLSAEVAKQRTRICSLADYFVLYSPLSPCFHILSLRSPKLELQYIKELCIPSHTLNQNAGEDVIY